MVGGCEASVAIAIAPFLPEPLFLLGVMGFNNQ
jgi:hypothetical protein